MFGHFLQAFHLALDFGSTFKQLTLVSGYIEVYGSALSLGRLLHLYFYAVMSQKHSLFCILIEFCI